MALFSYEKDFIERILDPSIDAKEAEEEAKAAAEWEAGREERERKAAEVAKEKEVKQNLPQMNTRNVTIEQLAERFNQTVWLNNGELSFGAGT